MTKISRNYSVDISFSERVEYEDRISDVNLRNLYMSFPADNVELDTIIMEIDNLLIKTLKKYGAKPKNGKQKNKKIPRK